MAYAPIPQNAKRPLKIQTDDKAASSREQSNKRSGARVKTKSETGERREKSFYFSPSLFRPRLTRVRLLRYSYVALNRFWEKIDCFTV